MATSTTTGPEKSHNHDGHEISSSERDYAEMVDILNLSDGYYEEESVASLFDEFAADPDRARTINFTHERRALVCCSRLQAFFHTWLMKISESSARRTMHPIPSNRRHLAQRPG